MSSCHCQERKKAIHIIYNFRGFRQIGPPLDPLGLLKNSYNVRPLGCPKDMSVRRNIVDVDQKTREGCGCPKFPRTSKFPIRLFLLSDTVWQIVFPPFSLMKLAWWSWASGYQTNLSLCFVGKTTTILIWCGKNSTVRQKISRQTSFFVF